MLKVILAAVALVALVGLLVCSARIKPRWVIYHQPIPSTDGTTPNWWGIEHQADIGNGYTAISPRFYKFAREFVDELNRQEIAPDDQEGMDRVHKEVFARMYPGGTAIPDSELSDDPTD